MSKPQFNEEQTKQFAFQLDFIVRHAVKDEDKDKWQARIDEFQRGYLAWLDAQPRPIETAPRDGTPFLSWNADHPEFGPQVTMRWVRWISDGAGFKLHDGGAWLHVLANEADYDQGYDTPKAHFIPFALAPDHLNTSVKLVWAPLPGSRK